jgi:hypothetical protein
MYTADQQFDDAIVGLELEASKDALNEAIDKAFLQYSADAR